MLPWKFVTFAWLSKLVSKLAKILVKKEFTIERNLLLSNSFRKIFCVRGIRWFDVKRNGDPYSNPVTYPFCLATLTLRLNTVLRKIAGSASCHSIVKPRRNFNRDANAIPPSYRMAVNKVMQSVLEVELGERFECLWIFESGVLRLMKSFVLRCFIESAI